MSKTLIDEALADAKQLKELAEDNAKRALIEAVTPRIKQLIESQLLGEADSDDSDVNESSEEDETESVTESQGLDPEFELNNESLRVIAPLLKTNPNVADKVELHVLALGETVQRVCRTAKKAVSPSKKQISELFAKVEDTYSQVHEAKAIDNVRRARLEEKLESYYAELNERFKEIGEMKNRSLNEAEGDDVTAGDAGEAPDMAPADEGGEDVVITLKGLKDIDVDSLNVDVQVGDESEGEEEPEVDAEEPAAEGDDVFGDMGGEEPAMESLDLDDDTILEISDIDLKREIARMRRMHESDSDVGKRIAKGSGGKGMPVDNFGGGKDDGDPWLDHEVTTEGLDEEYGMEEDASLSLEGDAMVELELEAEDAEPAMESVDEMDEMDEMDEECGADMAVESAVAEGKKPVSPTQKRAMLERKIQSEKAVQLQAQKKIQAYKTEAAKCRGTVRESQLKKRALAEVKRIKESQQVVADIQKTLTKEGAKKSAPSMDSVVKENSDLRSRLAEVSLFNAKLLYANKLMQTEGLTSAQKERIVDALDAAQSLREAKMLYTKLSDALKSGRKSVSEDARPRGRVLGSGSRVGQSSGAPMTEAADSGSVEMDRWAILAGLNKK